MVCRRENNKLPATVTEETALAKSLDEHLIRIKEDLGGQTHLGVNTCTPGLQTSWSHSGTQGLCISQGTKTTVTSIRLSYHATPLLCYVREFGISGMGKVTDDLNNTSAKAMAQQQQQYAINFLLVTYMNSLFRTGVPPASHLTKIECFTQNPWHYVSI